MLGGRARSEKRGTFARGLCWAILSAEEKDTALSPPDALFSDAAGRAADAEQHDKGENIAREF